MKDSGDDIRSLPLLIICDKSEPVAFILHGDGANEGNYQMDKIKAEALLGKMLLIRKFEERIKDLFCEGALHGTTHLCIGEEATAVGTIDALKKGDDVFATHRGHGVCLAKGMDPDKMMAEMFGKVTGSSKGRGGAMHFADPKIGMMGTNGVVGPSMALACGAAFAHKRAGDGNVAVAFFGDGATNEGIFHESMNLAAVWKVPVIYVCTNNTYGMSTPIANAAADPDLMKRAVPYGIKAYEVDGNDIENVIGTVTAAREYAVSESAPVFVLEHTYRTCGHSKSDDDYYRTEEEIGSWRMKDPLLRFEKKLSDAGVLGQEDISRLEIEAMEAVEKAVRFAEESPWPELEDVYKDVYTE